MFNVYETSHAPALIPPHKLAYVGAREDAVPFLEARNWTIVSFELDGPDHADIAATRTGRDLTLFTVARVPTRL